MRVGSLFTGIGGFDLGFGRAGCEVVWQSEIDKAASRVLAHRFPGVPNYGDITKVDVDELADCDIVTFGFPCQDLSTAGNRAGLAGARSGLFWEAARVIAGKAPRWILFENVPGLLTSDEGEDFGVVLGTLASFGYSLAYAVLDSQHHGVPQRRKRVFLVGCLEPGRAEQVLAVAHGGGGDTAPGGGEGENPQADAPGGLGGDSGPRQASGHASRTVACHAAEFGDPSTDNYAIHCADTARTLTSSSGNRGTPINEKAVERDLVIHDGVESLTPWPEVGEAHRIYGEAGASPPVKPSATHVATGQVGRPTANTVRSNPRNNSHPGSDPLVCLSPQGSPAGARIYDAVGASPTLRAGGHGGQQGTVRVLTDNPVPEHYSHDYSQDRIYSDRGVAPVQNASDAAGARNVFTGQIVRRLMPVECERLQGFPDAWTCVHDHPQPCQCPDGPRYKMCGNAVTVNVAQWLAERIVAVEQAL